MSATVTFSPVYPEALLARIFEGYPVPCIEYVDCIDDSPSIAGKADPDGHRILINRKQCGDGTQDAALVLHEAAHLLTGGGHGPAFFITLRALCKAFAGEWLYDTCANEDCYGDALESACDYEEATR